MSVELRISLITQDIMLWENALLVRWLTPISQSNPCQIPMDLSYLALHLALRMVLKTPMTPLKGTLLVFLGDGQNMGSLSTPDLEASLLSTHGTSRVH